MVVVVESTGSSGLSLGKDYAYRGLFFASIDKQLERERERMPVVYYYYHCCCITNARENKV